MAILVVNFHQPVDVAWRTTLREFFLIADMKSEARRRAGRTGWDANRMADFEDHLRRIGAEE